MTQDEFILKQRLMIEQLKNGSIMGIAVADTHTKMTARIFENGKKSDNSDIGQYGGKSLYINPDLSPKKFPVKGKPDSSGKSRSKFANGEAHKTAYFASYKDYRQKIGRPVGKVNLVLSGVLQSDFSNGLVKKDDFNYTVSLKNVKNREIAEGMEIKYGRIFALSASEVENFKDIFNFEFQKLLKNA